MANRTLSVWQTASLLVSTSCGIGFLMGTGELALQEGMAACLYAVPDGRPNSPTCGHLKIPHLETRGA